MQEYDSQYFLILIFFAYYMLKIYLKFVFLTYVYLLNL